uniref:POTRA domain-containing protein n=1 Tax=Schlesneria paludicola TaxID=360056 RepID=A0A7C2JXW3_9PLAN
MTQSDCGGQDRFRLQCALRRGVVHAVWMMLAATASGAEPIAGSGFTTPPTSSAAATAPVLEAVRIVGLTDGSGSELARALRCRPGQTPSRRFVADDVESLLATGRFAKVHPCWGQTATGWILTYEVAEQAPPVEVLLGADEPGEPSLPTHASYRPKLVVRGQDEDLPGDDPSPAPPARPMFPPVRPVAPEDLETTGGQTAFALEEPLADVKIEGNVTIPNSEIAKHVKTRPGRQATQSMIKDDVDALVRTRWFASVEPVVTRSDAGLVLIYRVLERPIVKRVEYRGAKKIKPEKLAALTNLKVGSPYDVSANRECARRIEEMYHEKGYAFATVELKKGNDRDDREVVFVIHEGSKVVVANVEFEGNEFFSDALLDLKLQTKQRILWAFGGKYDPATIPNDEASIRRYYNSLGFFDMQIEHALKFNEDKSRVVIVYKINEGMRYRIRRIDVLGNEVLTEEELRQGHQTASGEYYTERKIAGDVEKMRTQYGQLGRLFAKVDAVPRFTEEPGVVDILYKIDEDKVYRVREINVHIAGDHPHTRTNLVRNISLIQPGDLADPLKIQRTKTRLAGSGYFESDPQNGPRLDIKRVEAPDWIRQPDTSLARGQNRAETEPAPAPHSVARPPVQQPTPRTPADDEVTDEELDQFLRVIRGQSPDPLLAQSRGPDPVPQQYIYDSSPLGDPLNPAINDPDPLWNQMPPPEFIDIDAYLAEARTGRLMFGAGVNSNSGLVGNIVLSENNFDILRPPTSWEDVWNGTAWRGAGQKFRIEALPGSQVSRYLVDWQDPYFLDTNINLGVSGFYFTRFYRYWDEERLGGRVRLGKQLSQTWSASVALRMEGVHLGGEPSNSPPILLESIGDNFLSTVRVGVTHDTRDSAFLSSTGHYLEFAVEQAFAEYSYNRMEIEGRQYFTVYQRPDGAGKHILNLTGNFGWTSSGTPIFERFYAGGFQSFRGFAFRGVTPVENGIEVGGQFQLLGSVEYQVPVMANEMVKVVAFSDFGTVDEDVTLDNFRLSVGAGLRVTVPGMGPVPIALDWAVPILREDFDREQLFSFYIGINR